MGMTTKEFERQKADESIRFYIDSPQTEIEKLNWGDEWTNVVRDRTTGEVIGADGGCPEDQLLTRDWLWVLDALNSVANEAKIHSEPEEDDDGLPPKVHLNSADLTKLQGRPGVYMLLDLEEKVTFVGDTACLGTTLMGLRNTINGTFFRYWEKKWFEQRPLVELLVKRFNPPAYTS